MKTQSKRGENLRALGRFVGVIGAPPGFLFGTSIAARAGLEAPLAVGIFVLLCFALLAAACSEELPPEAYMDHRW